MVKHEVWSDWLESCNDMVYYADKNVLNCGTICGPANMREIEMMIGESIGEYNFQLMMNGN